MKKYSKKEKMFAILELLGIILTLLFSILFLNFDKNIDEKNSPKIRRTLNDIVNIVPEERPEIPLDYEENSGIIESRSPLNSHTMVKIK